LRRALWHRRQCVGDWPAAAGGMTKASPGGFGAGPDAALPPYVFDFRFLNLAKSMMWAAGTCPTWSGKRGWGVLLAPRPTRTGRPSPDSQDAPSDGGGLPSGCAGTAFLARADAPKDTEIDR
jgi:hypothetical protein